MPDAVFTPFETAIPEAIIPSTMNEPFSGSPPEICRIAARELQGYLSAQQAHWQHNFGLVPGKAGKPKGKMFGVLVVRTHEGKMGYLSAYSGKLYFMAAPARFAPSLLDVSTNDYFVDRGMTALSVINQQIAELDDAYEIRQLKKARKIKSLDIQQELFENYHFLNQKGELGDIFMIFDKYAAKVPPSGAGECSAPKLLQYAFSHQMEPVAIAEFWWGLTSKSGSKQHQEFYPACEEKCRPILSYMLGKECMSSKEQSIVE